jgi:hypothetical protein
MLEMADAELYFHSRRATNYHTTHNRVVLPRRILHHAFFLDFNVSVLSMDGSATIRTLPCLQDADSTPSFRRSISLIPTPSQYTSATR